MVLYKISDHYPNYRDVYFDGGDLKGMVVYSSENERAGYVSELLVDESDRLKYLVVDMNLQKRVIVPVRRCVKTTDEKSIYVRHLTLSEIHELEPYTEASKRSEGSEDMNVSDTSINPVSPAVGQQISLVEATVPVELTAPVEGAAVRLAAVGSQNTRQATVSRTTEQTRLQQKPQVSTVVNNDSSSIPLYEERLTTQKQRVKTGEVKISKRIVTETVEAQTPIKREKIIIEIESFYSGDTRIDFDDAKVAEDGSLSMGIYEDRTEICRQVVPYQNVSVRKEVIEDVVKTQQTLRREELSVNPDGKPYVEWANS